MTGEHERASRLHRWSKMRVVRLQAHGRRVAADGRLFVRHPLGLVGLALILFFGLMVLSYPVLRATVWDFGYYDPITGFDPTAAPHPSTWTWRHLLGTDNFGRDVLCQLFAGAQVSFAVGILAALIAVTISTTMGGAAGYFGGLVDAALMGVSDVFVLLPAPVVLLIFGLLLRMRWPTVAVLYGILTGLGAQAIVVKSHTLKLKARPFIEAARGAGGGDFHIILTHILPGLSSLTIVHAIFAVVGAVLTESLLAFFSRTTYYLSWGTMIWLGQETFRWFSLEGQWHAVLPPAFSIMLFCSGFYLVGRALDDVLNPRLRRR
ncbi:MAG: ABC transporter permease [Anaerolineae bacterium]|nr:ABC transporter permease [Anaerolineae bacterium]